MTLPLNVDARHGFRARKVKVIDESGHVVGESTTAEVLNELLKKRGLEGDVRADWYAMNRVCSECRGPVSDKTADIALRAGRLPRCQSCYLCSISIGEKPEWCTDCKGPISCQTALMSAKTGRSPLCRACMDLRRKRPHAACCDCGKQLRVKSRTKIPKRCIPCNARLSLKSIDRAKQRESATGPKAQSCRRCGGARSAKDVFGSRKKPKRWCRACWEAYKTEPRAPRSLTIEQRSKISESMRGNKNARGRK